MKQRKREKEKEKGETKEKLRETNAVKRSKSICYAVASVTLSAGLNSILNECNFNSKWRNTEEGCVALVLVVSIVT